MKAWYFESIQRINNTIAKRGHRKLNNQYSLELSLAFTGCITEKEIFISVPKAEPCQQIVQPI